MPSHPLPPRLLVLAALLVTSCAPPAGEPGSELEVRAAGLNVWELHAGGPPLAAVPVESIHLDRVTGALQPGGSRVLAVIHHGDRGGASLLALLGSATRMLLRTDRTSSLSTPVWSPDGERYALVVERAPRALWSGGARVLQAGGELWTGEAGAAPVRCAPALEDAGRVVGWSDDGWLLVTRLAPGDLPAEGLARVDPRSGAVRELVPAGGVAHHHGFTQVGDAIAFARVEGSISTAPAPDQRVQVLLADLDGRSRVVAEERGALPVELRLVDGELSYRLEGSSRVVTVELSSGARVERARPLARPGAPSVAPLLATFATMPYVHQVYDTPDDFAGYWACGPTSTVMAVQAFGRLKPWPVTVSTPSSHQSDFGAYVAYTYTAFGTTFDRMQTDSKGSPAHGAYGWCTDDGAGWAWRMQDYAKKHDLSSDFFGSSTFADLKAELDAGKAVVLSTQLTSAGHLITVKGYTSDGKLIVNDPYGDKTLGTYPNHDGGGAVYSWSYVSAKWHITVYGTPSQVEPAYRAVLVDQSSPATMQAGGTATVKLTYKNTGTKAWDADTRLGTSTPRDRASPFRAAGWIKENRAAAMTATQPGASATLTFSLTAPAVDETKTFTECFNLVQEGVNWFSDQGGPKDDAVCLTITVSPPGTAPIDPQPEEPKPDATPTPTPTPATPSSRPNAAGFCAVGGAADATLPGVLLLLLGLALARSRGRRR